MLCHIIIILCSVGAWKKPSRRFDGYTIKTRQSNENQNQQVMPQLHIERVGKSSPGD